LLFEHKLSLQAFDLAFSVFKLLLEGFDLFVSRDLSDSDWLAIEFRNEMRNLLDHDSFFGDGVSEVENFDFSLF
jgi:hypothetical protein